MGEASWPAPTHNSGAVTDTEYEQLALCYSQSGVYGSPADTALIYGDTSGRQVKVRASRTALVRGQLWASDGSGLTKAIAANSSGSTRFDLVVLRYDRSSEDARIQVITGTPGSGAPSPTQASGSSGVWELPLATVKVINGASTINAADVTSVAWYLGPPSIVCTSDTRPPPAAGLRIYETNTGREYVGNGTAFVTSINDSGWVSVAGNTTGGISSSCKARNYNGVIYIAGSFVRTGGSIGPNVQWQLGTMPGAMVPGIQVPVTFVRSGGAAGLGFISPAGVIAISEYGTAITTGQGIVISPTSYPLG